MEWIKAEQPPILTSIYAWEYPRSDPVLTFDGTTQRIARYEVQENEVCWISNCSESWELSGVTHWMPLPPNP